jgi:eukaryotic-like serine/threonine-protein kinase
MHDPAPSRQPPRPEPEAPDRGNEPTTTCVQLAPAPNDLRARAEGLSGRELLPLIREHQGASWGRGERVRVEWYLLQFPALAGDAEAVLALVGNEISLRRQAEEAPDLEEYTQRFPDHAAALRRDFTRDAAPPAGFPVTETAPGPDEKGAAADEAPPPPPAHPAVTPPRAALARSTSSPGVAPATPDGRTFGTILQGPEQGEAAARASAAEARPDLPGYEVLEKLGQGGMGVVYKARQLRPNRVVALKMMLAGAQASAEHRTRFRLETEAVARLRHPNIVQIYEVGEHEGRPFCCLEFLEGGNLGERLAGTPQPARPAAGLMETLARAMHAAHQQGVIHRDVKPANILLAADGTPKISDFGLAKQLDEDTGQTQAGAVMGTPPYMAPEQAAGRNRDIGPTTDVYALGAVLYELLTGRPPFRAATQVETLDQVRTQDPVPVRRLQPAVPRDVETICLKCLAKEPHKRYASALELAEDLRRFLHNEPIKGRPVPTWERGLKWVRRRPTAAALVVTSAVAVLSLLCGSLLYLGQRARDAEERARTAQQLLSEHERQEAVRQLVRDGEAAVAAQDWQNARLLLLRAVDRTGPDEEALGDLRAHAQALLQQAQQRLEEAAGRQKALERLRQFREKRDEALFYATLATGEGWLANVKKTRAAAREGLELAGVLPEGKAPPPRDASWTDEENAAAVAGCYELLLVLADADAQALPGEEAAGQLGQALRDLDRADSLGWAGHPTQVYHLRRARYLEQLGDPAAAAERRLAAARPLATALDYYLAGDEQYKQGNIPEAVRDFENALDKQPDHFWARYFLSVGYLRLGRAAEARVGLDACRLQRPTFVWVYLLRGFAHVQLNEFKEAEEDFQKAVRLGPERDAEHVLYANRGLLWCQQGQLDKAADDLRRAITLKPEEYQAYVTLAQVYQKQKKWAEAAQQLKQATDLEPDLAVLHRLRARLELDSPEPDLGAALRHSQNAMAIETRAGRSLTLAKDHAECGRILRRREQYAEALAAYEEALKIWPDYANAYLGRADAQLGLHKYEDVLDSLEEYLKRGGRPSREVYRVRGLARARLGKYADAIPDYTSALQLKPDDAGTRAARGWAYLACRAYQLAFADFDQVLRAEPDRADAYNGRAYARVQLGQKQAALEDAETAVSRGPPTADLLCDAAGVYAQVVGRMDAEPGPHSPRLLESRSACQERALELLRQALRSLPAAERGPFWRNRVRANAALGPLHPSLAFGQLDAQYSRQNTGRGTPP